MSVAQSSVHWKRLTQREAIPGWLLVFWKLMGELSTISFLHGTLTSVWSSVWAFLTSPSGNLVVILAGFVWLGFVILWPRSNADNHQKVSLPQRNTVPLEDQIYVHIASSSTSVIGDQASTSLVIFSAQNIDLTFCRVTITAESKGFTIESSRPLHIPAFCVTQHNLQRSLTPDEQQRFGEGRGRILMIEGFVYFGKLEKRFGDMVVEFL